MSITQKIIRLEQVAENKPTYTDFWGHKRLAPIRNTDFSEIGLLVRDGDLGQKRKKAPVSPAQLTKENSRKFHERKEAK